jgi:hypothetical protein
MAESFHPTPSEQQWSGSASPGNGYQGAFGPRPSPDDESGEAGKVLLVGVLGGLLSAAGYMIYRRLPDEQRDRLHKQVRSLVQQRVDELRRNFNI